jgi:hypothetical protein
MSEPVLLSFEKHGKLRLGEEKDFTQFKSQHLVPVVFQEFYALATQFPLIFVRNSNTGDFVPAALMGLSKGKNLFCQQPQWQAAFVPTSFTLAPLSVHRLQPDSNEAVIAIDEKSNLLSESVGEPLFQADGDYTAYLQKRIDHVVNVTRQSLQALALCRFLAEKKLFRSRTLNFQYSDTSPKYELEGVFVIDEEALEKLGDEEFLELRRRGLLPLIYSHLTSLHQLSRLLRLQHQSDRQAASAPETGPDQQH